MVELILLIVLLRFLRGIIEGIFDVELDLFSIIENVTYYIKSFANSVKALRKKSAVERTASKLNSFTTLEELPADLEVLKQMWNHYSMTSDERRRFLCLKKWAELPVELTAKDPPPFQLLAKYYWKGIGTEQNEAEGRNVQNAYFLKMLKNKNHLELYAERLTDPDFTFDPVGLVELAKELFDKSRDVSIFFLEEGLLAQALGLKVGATIPERVAAYESAPDHHCSLFHLWLYGGKKDENLRYYAKKRDNLADDLEGCEYEFVFRKVNETAASAAQAHGLFLAGVKEYEAGKDDLFNKAWEKIDRAAAFGSRQAEIWALRKRTELGDREAEGKLAQLYLEGDLNVRRDTPRGKELMRHAAEQGDAFAQRRMGMILSSSAKSGEEAHYWYQKAAAQHDVWSSLQCGLFYMQKGNFDEAKARSYLVPLTSLTDTDKETVKIRRQALEAMLKLCCGVGRRSNIEPYPGLKESMKYAVAFAELESVIRQKHSELELNHLLDCYVRSTALKMTRDARSSFRSRENLASAMICETFSLWFINLMEPRSENLCEEDMIELFRQYRMVGIPEYLTGDRLHPNQLIGNEEKRYYWIKRAIDCGSVEALWLLGHEGVKTGLSWAEREKMIYRAAQLGHRSAQLYVEKDRKARAAEAEEERWERLQEKEHARQAREYQRQKDLEASRSKAMEENMDAAGSVLDMPETITGPYNHTYRRTSISAYSAEYTNEFYQTVVIENRDIGLTGFSAKTKDGYFYW